MDALRSYIVSRRKELKLSQVDLANRAGIPSATIAAIEAGRVTRHPRFDTLQAIAKGLGVSSDTLQRIVMGLPEPPEKPVRQMLLETLRDFQMQIPKDLEDVSDILDELRSRPPEQRARYVRIIRDLLELPPKEEQGPQGK